MSAGDKQKFIKQVKGSFKDETTGVAGMKSIPQARGSKNQTDEGVSRKLGYADVKAPAYEGSPKGL